MAMDKAVDSSVLDVNLQSIAETIREKSGTSAALAFPDGFVDAIRNIESGFSLPNIKAITAGTYTPASTVTNSASLKITHGLGELPDMAVFFAAERVFTGVSNAFMFSYSILKTTVFNGTTYTQLFGGRNTSSVGDNQSVARASSTAGSTAYNMTATTITPLGGSSGNLLAGETYYWIAIKFTTS